MELRVPSGLHDRAARNAGSPSAALDALSNGPDDVPIRAQG